MADKEKKQAQEAQERKPIKLPVNSEGYIDTDKLTPEELEEYNANLDEINAAAMIASGVATQIYNDLQDAKQNIKDSKANGQLDELQEIFPDTMAFIESRSKIRNGFGILATWTAVLSPIFSHFDNFKEHLKEIGYTGTLEEFITPEEDPDTGETGASLFDLWQAEVEPESVTPADNTPSVGGRRVKDLDYPVDKINNVVWDLLQNDTQGQITFAGPLKIKAEPNNRKKQVNFLYSIDFSNIDSPIVKRLDEYDKLVYIAVGALWKIGNNTMTVSQIYHAMGNKGNPGKSDREKIDNSMTKFHAIIYFSNAEEIAAGYKYPSHVYDGPLLPFYRDTERNCINGQFVNATYHITIKNHAEQIPLIQFAAERNQISTVPLKVFQAPVNKNKESLRIQDYLIERIERARKGSQPAKILFSTIFDHARAVTYKQKERARKKVITYLDYYVECGYIKGYTKDKKSISLSL